MYLDKTFTLLLIILVCFSCGSQKQLEHEASMNNPFFAYNFGGLENLSPQEQVDILKKYGYQGICLRMATEENVEALPEFLRIADKTEDFKIYAAFIRYNFNESEKDRNRWREVVELIANKGIDLWIIFGKYQQEVGEEKVEAILRDMVAVSTKNNIPVTLYPHHNCYFYSAEQALPMVKKINHPNLKLALHTYHELKDGQGYRLAEVVPEVADYLSFVTIAGADLVPDRRSGYLLDQSTIQPLEDSDYDYDLFLKSLKKAKYKGPVGLMNFGFKKEPTDYLPKSMAEWQKLKNKYLD